MKLKLEQEANQPVVYISEAIQPQEGAVLRAGLLKLIRSSTTKQLWADLTQVTGELSPQVLVELRTVTEQASTEGLLLLWIGPQSGVTDATTKVELTEKLKDPLFVLKLKEKHISSRLDYLKQKKQEINSKLNAAGGADVLSLRREAANLKISLKQLETAIYTLLKALPKTLKPMDPANAPQPNEIERTLQAILKQEGWLNT